MKSACFRRQFKFFWDFFSFFFYISTIHHLKNSEKHVFSCIGHSCILHMTGHPGPSGGQSTPIR